MFSISANRTISTPSPSVTVPSGRFCGRSMPRTRAPVQPTMAAVSRPTSTPQKPCHPLTERVPNGPRFHDCHGRKRSMKRKTPAPSTSFRPSVNSPRASIGSSLPELPAGSVCIFGRLATSPSPRVVIVRQVLAPEIFKAYDIRGLYPSELDEEGGYAVGRAYVEEFGPKRIAIGRDMRVSSPAMARAVQEGAADGGADVLDLGMVGTEMVYFAVGALELDGGIAVTASHNPKQYTGMKIVRAGALPVGGDSGLLEVRDRALAADWRDAPRGQISDEDIWGLYVERVLSFVDVSSLRPLRVVIDAANGMAGTMLPPVLDRLPMLEVERCYFEPDGTFPNHEPNPLLPENREFIIAKTRKGADFGVAFDGDADRCFFVDDTGEFVPGDFATALFAE